MLSSSARDERNLRPTPKISCYDHAMRATMSIAALLLVSCTTIVHRDPDSAPTAQARLVWAVESSVSRGSAVPFRTTMRLDGGFDVWLLTARHMACDENQKPWPSLALHHPPTGLRLLARVHSTHVLHDVAVIRARSRQWVRPMQLCLGPTRAGDVVWAVGFPGGQFSISRGVASSETRATAPIAPGSSGGALMRGDGRVVAITTSVRTLLRGGMVHYLWHDVGVVPIRALLGWLPAPLSRAPDLPSSRRSG